LRQGQPARHCEEGCKPDAAIHSSDAVWLVLWIAASPAAPRNDGPGGLCLST
jgi:hypothetical protein